MNVIQAARVVYFVFARRVHQAQQMDLHSRNERAYTHPPTHTNTHRDRERENTLCVLRECCMQCARANVLARLALLKVNANTR